MATRFIVGCGTIVHDDKGRLLMVRQMGGYWKGQWIFPGGKLELGETLEQCARREFMEETGCDVNVKRLIGAYTSYDPNTEFEKQVVLIYFLGNSLKGNPSAGEGVTDIGWFSPEEIERMAKSGQSPYLILKVMRDAFG
jgi:8-oxo-dGTP diphosphatase